MNTHDGPVDAVAFVKQLDLTDEVKMEPGHTYVVRTKSGSLYTHDQDGVRFHGSTFGGPMIALDRLIPGAYLEFSKNGTVYSSSPIVAIYVDESP